MQALMENPQAAALMAQVASLLAQSAGSAATSGPNAPSAAQAPAPPIAPAAAAQPAVHAPAFTPEFVTQSTQDYGFLTEYWLVEHYHAARNGIPPNMRLQHFTEHAIKLGGVHLNERSSQLVVACYLLANREDPRVQEMTSFQKHALLQTVKDQLRREARKCPSQPCLKALPHQPSNLYSSARTQHLYEAAFKDSSPVPFPFSTADLQATVFSIPMRVSRYAHSDANAFSAVSGGGGGGADGGLRMLQMFMQMAGQMQQQDPNCPGLQIFGAAGSGGRLRQHPNRIQTVQVVSLSLKTYYLQNLATLSILIQLLCMYFCNVYM